MTVLVLVFGGISLFYLWRTVGGDDQATEQLAVKAKKENRMTDYKQLREQADQLRTRMQARVPIKGSLSFLDSRGTPHADGNRRGPGAGDERAAKPHRGGDSVGGDLELRHRPRSVHAARAGRRSCSNRRIPVEDFILPGTIEWQLDRVYELAAQIDSRQASKEQPNVTAAKISQLDAAISRNQAELERARAEYDALTKRADELEGEGGPGRRPPARPTRPRGCGARPPRFPRRRSRSR